jgi:hypothetical protein
VISRPTTEQILKDCSRELMEVVLPAVTDQTVQVTVMMLDLVLRNASVRAAHEVAWMTEEAAELEAFAGGAASNGSLHLDDVVQRYCAASDAFATVMDAAVASGDDARIREGAALMDRRVAREEEVMSGWSPVGR